MAVALSQARLVAVCSDLTTSFALCRKPFESLRQDDPSSFLILQTATISSPCLEVRALVQLLLWEQVQVKQVVQEQVLVLVLMELNSSFQRTNPTFARFCFRWRQFARSIAPVELVQAQMQTQAPVDRSFDSIDRSFDRLNLVLRCLNRLAFRMHHRLLRPLVAVLWASRWAAWVVL